MGWSFFEVALLFVCFSGCLLRTMDEYSYLYLKEEPRLEKQQHKLTQSVSLDYGIENTH